MSTPVQPLPIEERVEVYKLPPDEPPPEPPAEWLEVMDQLRATPGHWFLVAKTDTRAKAVGAAERLERHRHVEGRWRPVGSEFWIFARFLRMS